MKQEYKISMKLFAFVMALLMLLVSLPVAAFANAIQTDTTETSTSVDTESKTEKKDIIVLEEDKALRDENIKHFKLSDGTTKAVVYSQAVHYKDADGKWVDIDNALTLNGSEYSSNNKQTVKFANKSGSNGLVSIKDGDYKIDFTPLNTNKIKVEIVNPQTNNSRKFEDMSQLDNLVSKAIYKNIYDGIDIEYILVGNNIKENIIVKEKQDSYTFSFELKLNKLSAELVNGAIILSDYDTGTKVYEIPAPYMFDANNEYSNNVSYTLIQDSKWKYTFTVTANAEWINADDRVFPVTVDPMIYTNSNVESTYYAKSNQNNGARSYLSIGGSSSSDNYAFIKFSSFPTIPDGATITNTKLNAIAYSLTNGADLDIGVFQITNSWSNTTPYTTALTYFDKTAPVDYVNINSLGNYEWDITKLFKKWQTGASNHGLALKVINTANLQSTYVYLASSRNSIDMMPKLEVSYTTINGIESYYSYYQSSANLAGEGYVNAFTGNLTFVHNIFTTADEIMPFNLFTTYNSATKKWILNIDETVESVAINEIQHYKWIDGDGTEHWFSPYIKERDTGGYDFYQYNEAGEEIKVTTPTEFYDQSGLGLKITVSNDKIYISDDKGNKKEFINGELSSIEDTYGNKRTFVTTGTQTNIYLQPNGENTPILQLTINEYDTDIIIENKQTGINAVVFNYSLIDRIDYVLDVEGNYYSINFSYSNRYLLTAKNSKNDLGVQYSYVNGKVVKITEIANAYSSTVSKGNEMGISYGTISTTSYTAGADRILNNGDDLYFTYCFDYSGRVITAYSHDDYNNIYNSSSYQYNDMYKNKGVGLKLHNSLNTSFINGATTPNYIYNGAFENGITGWTTGGTGTVLVDVYDGYDTFDAIDYGRSLIMQSTEYNISTAKQTVYLTPGTYTLSSSIYTGDMLLDASLVIEVYNSANTKIASSRVISKENATFSFNDWKKEIFNLDISVAGNYTVIIKYTEGENPTNLTCALVDEIMLERSQGNGTFSAYGNGGFETSLHSDSENKNATLSTVNALQGNKSLKLTPTFTDEAYYKETYNVCGDYFASDSFVISGWAMANAVPSSNKGTSKATFCIELKVYYEGTTRVDTLVVPFETDYSGWQYVSQAVTVSALDANGSLAGTVNKIEIYLRYDYNYESAYFDNICFARSGKATYYTYNALGNVTVVKDSNGNCTKYDYNNGNGYDVTDVTDMNDNSVSVDYDQNHNPISSTYTGNGSDASDEIKTDYEKNSFGQITQCLTSHSTSSYKIKTATSYVLDTSKNFFSRVETETDVNGAVTTYEYNDKGQLTRILFNCQSGVEYVYNAYGQLVSAIPLKYKASTNEYLYYSYEMTDVEYVYNENDNQLDKIIANTEYNFEYDEFGNMTSFSVSDSPLAKYEYVQNNGNLKKLRYENGAYIEYTYDSLERIVAVCYNGVEEAIYTYTPNGEVYTVTDLKNGIVYQYTYDGKGVLLNEIATKNGATHYNKSYDYDDQGRIIEKRITLPENESSNNMYWIIYDYDVEGRLEKIENEHTGITNTYSYNVMGNLENDILFNNNGVFINKKYFYETYDTDYLTGNISSTLEYIDGKEYRVHYTYDSRGNITQIMYQSVTDGNIKRICYEYDAYNQLIREDNQLTGYTYMFTYDSGGNLRGRDVWNFELGTITQGPPLYYDIFQYNEIWKDAIVGYVRYVPMQEATPVYEGTITYDAIGNPLSYYNGTSYSFKWQNGRQLAEATVNGEKYIYKYNQDGIRLSKQNDNTLVEYILDGMQIVCERVYAITRDINGNIISKTLTAQTLYSYDANGTPNGARICVYNGTNYDAYDFFFRTNLQGDVLAIYDKTTKQQVVSFNYNAWGEYTTNVYNTALSQISLNYTHLRYRGYYQDFETGFYYLNSRYYDAKMCKFINADAYVNANGDFVGFNMYAYCSNNPVMYVDMTGEEIVLAVIVGICLLGGVLFFSSCEDENTDLTYKQIPMSDEAPSEYGVVYYSIGSATVNGTTEPSIKIYNSYNYRTSKVKKEILEYIIKTPEGIDAGLSKDDIDYYLNEWSVHNYAYKHPQFAAQYMNISVASVMHSSKHVDLNTNDPRRSKYEGLGQWAEAMD